jgi:hypothetical protein
MRSSCLVGLVIASLAALGCARVAESPPPQGPTPSTPSPSTTAPPAGERAAPDPSTTGSSPSGTSRDAAGAAPFIAEMRSLTPVVNIRRTGRLEVVGGCLTVTVEGEERATAVFPPGVRPEMRDGELVAVTFDADRIPVGQETDIPGGAVELSSAELARPVPDDCPRKLFGLGG